MILKGKRIVIALLPALLLFPLLLSAKYTAVTHFTQEQGFPGKFAYRLFQDKAGYIWISTENGMTRYNGYEFKLFTINDGLPDNEILNFAEDDSSRLWFTPFAHTIGYIKNGRVFHSGNDPLLSRLHFDTKTESILSDRFGNIVVAEKARVTCISREGKIKIYRFTDRQGINLPFIIAKTKSNEIYLTDCAHNLYRYDSTNWHYITRLPALSFAIAANVVETLGLEGALSFFDQMRKYRLPFYYKVSEAEKINSMFLVSPGVLGIARADGLFLADIASSRVTDTLLYGCPVAIGMVASDSSLWLCTHGQGVYRFKQSPIKSLPLTAVPRSVTYMKASENKMYAAIEKGQFVKAFISGRGDIRTAEMRIPDYKRPDQIFRYIDFYKNKEWIGINNRICVFKDLNQAPIGIGGIIGFKDIIEEDEQHLLIATFATVERFDKESKRFTDTLFPARSTCVAKVNEHIFAGTLDGLYAIEAGKVPIKILPGSKALNTHISRLCAGTDHVLWVANSKAELIALKDGKIAAIISNKTGLRCTKIAAISVSERFVLVATDNGLYMLENKAPYKIARYLSSAMGLNSNQVNCLAVAQENIWIGTSEGINYFRQDDVFAPSAQARLIINNIVNDSIIYEPADHIIELPLKSLRVDFDVIDHSGGQKPLFQYRLNNDSSWIAIDNHELFFPEVPYGHFQIELRAASPNWKAALSRQLRFHRPYPFYMQWWFIAAILLAFLLTTACIVRRTIRQTRRKDQEKAATQRQLLQLEQMALQGQMNPHFIFNCISAIKQFYNNGDNEQANILVDKFAALIRETFEMGTQLFVPLDQEINYLRQYLSIEQTRFNDSFDYAIHTELQLPASSIYVPVMLLQPLAENAVRHGIRHLSTRRGMVSVSVRQQGNWSP